MKKQIDWIEQVVLLWLLVLVIAHGVFGLKIVKISGRSMASTFEDGDFVVAMEVRDCSALQRGDIITFYSEPGGKVMYIKRIIGLPGETIEADDNLVFVDGEEVSFWHGTGTWGPVTIPEDAVFVLGDNRAVSVDSRFLGCVPFQQICTKVIGDCRRK